MAGIGLSLPAARGHQGDRDYYIVSVPNAVLNNFFTVNMDPPEEKSQRPLNPKHAKEIAEYILSNPSEYVLPTVVYAVDNTCEFTPSELSPDVGVLTITAGTNMRCLDGQHRRQGLNEAIAEEPDLAKVFTSILIYVEPDVIKRRQMFSDMNATPVRVSTALNISFDSRNPFARVTKKLSEDHPHFAGVFESEAGRVKPSSPRWYALNALFKSLLHLESGPSARVKDYDQFKDEDLYKVGTQFLDLLWDSRYEFKEVAEGRATAESMRLKSIMFWGSTMRALAAAIWLARDAESRYGELSEFGPALKAIDFSPGNARWSDVGFILPGKTTPLDRFKPLTDASHEILRLLKRKS